MGEGQTALQGRQQVWAGGLLHQQNGKGPKYEMANRRFASPCPATTVIKCPHSAPEARRQPLGISRPAFLSRGFCWGAGIQSRVRMPPRSGESGGGARSTPKQERESEAATMQSCQRKIAQGAYHLLRAWKRPDILFSVVVRQLPRAPASKRQQRAHLQTQTPKVRVMELQ